MRLDEISRLHVFFSPRSTFDLVRSGQRSNFREKWHFLALHAHSGVSMCCSDLITETFTTHQRVPCSILNKIEYCYGIPLQYLAYAVLLSRTTSPSLSVIAVTVKIQIGRDDEWPRGWGRSGLETFLGTMNHRFRFSASGNPTKHMPIGYLTL